MLVKANVSFSGALTMYKGEIKECNDEVVLQDLLNAGYIEEVAASEKEVKETTTKGGKKSESKRSPSK